LNSFQSGLEFAAQNFAYLVRVAARSLFANGGQDGIRGRDSEIGAEEQGLEFFDDFAVEVPPAYQRCDSADQGFPGTTQSFAQRYPRRGLHLYGCGWGGSGLRDLYGGFGCSLRNRGFLGWRVPNRECRRFGCNLGAGCCRGFDRNVRDG